jgi:integrase
MPGKDFQFHALAVDRAPWANANPVRAIFREACALAGLPYFNPHSLRNTLVQLAYELKRDAERFKAWSQNLGHESCLTTFSSYGQIPPARRAEIIRGLAAHLERSNDWIDPALLRRLADEMERSRTLSQ